MVDKERLIKSSLLKREAFTDGTVKVNICKIKEHPIHIHDFLEIIFVIRGKIEVKSSFDHFTLSAGEYILINAFELHSVESLCTDTYIAYIYFSKVTGIDDPLLMYDINVLKRDHELYETLKTEIVRLIESAPGEREECADDVLKLLYSNLKHAGFLMSGDKNEYKGSEDHINRISDIMTYMYLAYDEDLSLEHVSGEFHISRYYLSHIIKKAYGISFKQMLNIIRADRAELLILATDKSISEISMDAGFSSQQYFSRCFRENFGYTPLQYRKRFREKTLRFRCFDEVRFDAQSVQIAGIAGGSGNGYDIMVHLENGDYKVYVIRETEEGITAEAFSTDDPGSLDVDFHCDQMTLVIRRSR